MIRLRSVTLATALAAALPLAALAQTTPAPSPPAQSPPSSTAPAPTDAPAATPPAASQPAPDAATPSPAPQATPAPAPQPPAAEAPAPSAEPKVQAADAFGEETTLTPRKSVILKGKATWDSAFETLMDAFKSVVTHLDKQGVTPSGPFVIVYTATDDSGFTYLAEVPVDQDPKALGKNMSVGQTPEGKALKFTHRGSYDNMDNTYEAITNFLDEKKLEAKDLFIEEYTTDPLKTAEDKLVINVYVPLK